jgi:hypothetical protein
MAYIELQVVQIRTSLRLAKVEEVVKSMLVATSVLLLRG